MNDDEDEFENLSKLFELLVLLTVVALGFAAAILGILSLYQLLIEPLS